MHGLQACLFKYITVAALHIYAPGGVDDAKREVGGHALNCHENYIVDHGKSWENHGILFLNFCVNLECRTFRPRTFRPRTFRPGHFGHGRFSQGKCQRWTFRPKP